MGSGEGSAKRNFTVCTVHLILSVIKSRRLRWAGHVASMKEGRSVYNIVTGKRAGKRRLGRPRRRWEEHIRMDLE